MRSYRAVMPLAALAAGLAGLLALYPLTFLVMPAAAIWVSLPGGKRRDPVERLAISLGAATAIWVVSMWWFSAVGLPYAALTWSTVLLSIGAYLFAIRKRLQDRHRFSRDPEHRWLLLGAIALCAVRFIPAWTQLAAPGADMSMHTYVAALFQRAGGIPDGFQPLLPLDGLAAYAPGFHSLVAVAADWGHVSLLAAGLYVSCFVYALFGLALYAFVRRFAGGVPSLAATVLIAFGAPHPQDMFVTGTTPAILSLAFAVIAAAQLVAYDQPRSRLLLVLTGLVLAAVPLSHSIPALTLIYVGGPVFALAFLLSRGGQADLLRQGLSTAAVSVVLLLPYLFAFANPTSDAEVRWAFAWQDQLWPGSLLSLPVFLSRYGGKIALGLCAVAFLWIAWRRESRMRVPAAIAVLLMALIANAKFRILPFSHGLYPDRLAQAFLVPAAAFFAIGCERLLSPRKGLPIAAWQKPSLALLLVAPLALWGSYQHYFKPAAAEQAVASDDLEAFEWIAENLPADALFLNNYGDAGLWLPALTLRPAVVIHTVPFFLEEIRALQDAAAPQYVYVGAGSPARFTPAFDAQPFLAQPELFVRIFQAGDAQVFRALDPAGLREWFHALPFVQQFRANYQRMTAPPAGK